MDKDLVGWIKSVLIKQNIVSKDDTVEIDVNSVVQMQSKSQCVAKVNGVTQTLTWKQISFSDLLYQLIAKENGQVFYSVKDLRPKVKLKPGFELKDLNEALGTKFSEEELVYAPQRFIPVFKFNHPCFYGSVVVEVINK